MKIILNLHIFIQLFSSLHCIYKCRKKKYDCMNMYVECMFICVHVCISDVCISDV